MDEMHLILFVSIYLIMAIIVIALAGIFYLFVEIMGFLMKKIIDRIESEEQKEKD